MVVAAMSVDRRVIGVPTATEETGEILRCHDFVLVDRRKKREIAKGQYRGKGMVWVTTCQAMSCREAIAHTAEEAAERFWWPTSSLLPRAHWEQCQRDVPVP